MKTTLGIIIIVTISIGIFWKLTHKETPLVVTSFEECAATGSPVMESYPRQCRYGDQTFTEDVGNELEKTDLIHLNTPPELPETTIKSTAKKVLPKFYTVENNKVHYYQGVVGGNSTIDGDTDPATFEYIGHYNYNDYAKDKNGVYFNNRVIEGADPKTFQYVGGPYTKDKSHVYAAYAGFDEQMNYSGARAIIKDADVATFQFIGGVYAKDALNIFNGNQIMKNVDFPTFVYIGSKKEYEYVGPMDGPMDEGYAKDKNYIYFYGRPLIMENIDVDTFIDIGGGYAKDKGKVYCHGANFVVPYPDAFDDATDTFTVDVPTFEYAGNHYAKDKDNVYMSDDYCQHRVNYGVAPSMCTSSNLIGCRGI